MDTNAATTSSPELGAMEIDLQRLLLRLQSALADKTHSSVNQDEILRRWTFVERAQALLQGLEASLTSDEDSRRIATYADKLNFISQLLLAGEGHRPPLYVATQNPEPQATSQESEEPEKRLRRQALSAEEQHARSILLGSGRDVSRSPGLGTDADIRRRLGLTSDTKGKSSLKEADMTKQLEQDNELRDALAEDVLNLITTLKENSLNVQKSLQSDTSRIEIVDNLLNQNLANVKKEISRVDTLFRSTSASCRANCALVTTVLAIWIAVYIVMKITPRPSS